jgi:hypothetical protein
LQKDKENLLINLSRAEEEVKILKKKLLFGLFVDLYAANIVLLCFHNRSRKKEEMKLIISYMPIPVKVNLLFGENKMLGESNKKLLALLEREKERHQRSERKNSTSASATVSKLLPFVFFS